ncbi:LysR family transcriptional regulator [Massilia dura]|uniref:LysR family transcriptional regulator n=1 Tax=Pseudoduganella dura TaxID=321982 RepID=A0A6I3XG42_9BURK|nr:LysR family transcriptional regulator [Pseudoduganella dura]MUI11698.1 LysR family transcriptional regulator [Pseudoduganella dura]GGX78413.1 LysR family transcriptional regulator [Pseudoduganella dura]
MHFSIDQLLAFHAAAELGSFSAAARRLCKAQSVISTAVANLEADLGVQLFDRAGRYPRLTPAGERLVKDAGRIIGECQHMQALAGELAGGVEPRLTLAIDDDSHLPWLERVLGDFATRFPRVELELLFPLMEDLLEMIGSGRAHLGVGYEQQGLRSAIRSHGLGSVEVALVVAARHPLARQGTVTRTELASTRQIALTARTRQKSSPEIQLSSAIWWVEGDPAVLEMVRQGHGWAIVPLFVANSALERGEVVRLQSDYVAGLPVQRLEVLWHRAHAHRQAGQWLRQALLEHGRDVFGDAGA